MKRNNYFIDSYLIVTPKFLFIYEKIFYLPLPLLRRVGLCPPLNSRPRELSRDRLPSKLEYHWILHWRSKIRIDFTFNILKRQIYLLHPLIINYYYYYPLSDFLILELRKFQDQFVKSRKFERDQVRKTEIVCLKLIVASNIWFKNFLHFIICGFNSRGWFLTHSTVVWIQVRDFVISPEPYAAFRVHHPHAIQIYGTDLLQVPTIS